MFLLKRNNGYWYVIYKMGKRMRWKTTKSRDKEGALVFLEGFKKLIPAKPERLLLSEFSKQFEELQGVNLRESTVMNIYRPAFKNFISVCGDKDMRVYTARDVDLFKAKRIQTCSPTTVNIEFKTLKAAFNCAVRWDILKVNPFLRCSPLRVPEKRPKYLTPEEFIRLRNATTDPLLKRMFELAVLTGMRRGEIQNLQWQEVDFERKHVVVSNSESHLTKTGKIRAVPMSDRVIALLQELKAEMDQGTYVFQYNHHKMAESYITHKFRVYRMAAGLPEGVTFHSLRHTFATWLVRQGVPIFDVQKLLGHSDVKVTQIYSHLDASELHGDVNKIVL